MRLSRALVRAMPSEQQQHCKVLHQARPARRVLRRGCVRRGGRSRAYILYSTVITLSYTRTLYIDAAMSSSRPHAATPAASTWRAAGYPGCADPSTDGARLHALAADLATARRSGVVCVDIDSTRYWLQTPPSTTMQHTVDEPDPGAPRSNSRVSIIYRTDYKRKEHLNRTEDGWCGVDGALMKL